MLPSQFSIIAVSQFAFTAQVPLIVLGAIMAGGDWTSGTLRTTVLQGAGRTRAYLGQLAALSLAAVASTVLTFAVAAGASLAVRALEPAAVSSYTGAIPPTPAIAGALAAAVLIALAYAALGLALGTICRSAVVAMGIALVWTMVIDSTLYQLAITAGGPLRTISDLAPGPSAVTLSGLFGTPGGEPRRRTTCPSARRRRSGRCPDTRWAPSRWPSSCCAAGTSPQTAPGGESGESGDWDACRGRDERVG